MRTAPSAVDSSARIEPNRNFRHEETLDPPNPRSSFNFHASRRCHYAETFVEHPIISTRRSRSIVLGTTSRGSLWIRPSSGMTVDRKRRGRRGPYYDILPSRENEGKEREKERERAAYSVRETSILCLLLPPSCLHRRIFRAALLCPQPSGYRY